MTAAKGCAPSPQQEITARDARIEEGNSILAGLPQVLSVTDVAGLLGISGQSVRNLLRTRQIPGRKIGRRWYVPCARLDVFLSGDGV
jgi:excisionase family DNA binding protein